METYPSAANDQNPKAFERQKQGCPTLCCCLCLMNLLETLLDTKDPVFTRLKVRFKLVGSILNGTCVGHPSIDISLFYDSLEASYFDPRPVL